ncbi:MAG: hypothetical protein AAB533_02465 [Patescibacteria group bacterium]
MEHIIGLKELRERTDVYIRGAARGRSFLVVRRSRPVFRITPPDEAPELWETVVDFTKVKRGGVSLDEILKRL